MDLFLTPIDEARLCIKVISDIHLELIADHSYSVQRCFQNSIPTVLVLAGDIGNPYEDYFEEFLKECKAGFNYVVLVAGNHEYYAPEKHRNMAKSEARLDDVCRRTGCSFLNKNSIVIKGVRFAGCTMWSHIPEDIHK